MINDLANNSFPKIWGSMRRVLVVASITLAIGIAAIGSGRTIEASKSSQPVRMHSASQGVLHQQLQPESVELLHEIKPQLPQTAPQPRIVMMEVTAYCACTKCCGPNAQGITASGKDVTYNAGKFVAADRSMPFGTKLLIPGYDSQPVEVIDRGGAIKGNKLDVFYASHDEALEWGRRTLPVTVLE